MTSSNREKLSEAEDRFDSAKEYAHEEWTDILL